ncbi:hypothetical protein V565_292030, partial [Rhizoctonia solani 123E]
MPDDDSSEFPGDWLAKLVFAGAEQIPGVGEIVSIMRGYKAQDNKHRLKYAFDYLQGLARDALLIAGEDTFSVMLIHSIGTAVSDEAVQIWDPKADHSQESFNVDQASIDKLREREEDHDFILLPHKKEQKEGEEEETVIKPYYHFHSTIAYFGSAFSGKFTYEKDDQKHFATNENFTLVFPVGVHPNAVCIISTSWSRIENGENDTSEKVPLILADLKITNLTESGTFELHQAGSVYSWDATLKDKGKTCELVMREHGDKFTVSDINLTRVEPPVVAAA